MRCGGNVRNIWDVKDDLGNVVNVGDVGDLGDVGDMGERFSEIPSNHQVKDRPIYRDAIASKNAANLLLFSNYFEHLDTYLHSLIVKDSFV